jgi:hypothetical protein
MIWHANVLCQKFLYPVRNNAPLEFLTGFTSIVIPGLTRNPVFLDWIPTGVYPGLDTGRE